MREFLVMTGTILFLIVAAPVWIPWFFWEEIIQPSLGYIPAFGKVLWMAIKRETIWAIGFHGFVEIRACTKAPRAIRSESEKDGFRWRLEAYETKDGRFRTRHTKVPDKFHIANVIHTGGKVLKSVDSSSFWRAAHMIIPVGECVKLTKKQAVAVLGGKGASHVDD